jgi:hypothetical protein
MNDGRSVAAGRPPARTSRSATALRHWLAGQPGWARRNGRRARTDCGTRGSARRYPSFSTYALRSLLAVTEIPLANRSASSRPDHWLRRTKRSPWSGSRLIILITA